jgi:hypothetical protein
MDDGRRISAEQRGKIYAMVNEIADWMGDYPESVKRFFKMDFVLNRLQSMERKMFSLSNVDMTTAREFIEFLIEFIISHDVPCREPLWKLQDDSGKYVYSCLMNKKCCICGQAAQLHHVDRIGMGNDRTKVEHVGREALPLCAEHHAEIHNAPEEVFYSKYHLRPVKIDKDIAARLRKLHLVEGRYPKIFLSAYTAKTVDDKELKMEYIRNKSFNDLHFKDMIVQYLRSFGGATRAELNTLLQSKLSDVLTEEQKIRKIGNMLSALKKKGVIKLTEKKKWVLVEV